MLKQTFYPVKVTPDAAVRLTLVDSPVPEASAHEELPEALREPARAIDAINRCLSGSDATLFAHPKWVEGLSSKIIVDYVFGDAPRTDPREEEIRRALIQTSAAKAGVPAPVPPKNGTLIVKPDAVQGGDDDEEGPEV